MDELKGIEEALAIASKRVSETHASNEHVWHQGQGRNMLMALDMQIRLAAVKLNKESSDDQGKQTRALVLWTKIMVAAIIAQVIVGTAQAWIYFQQLQAMQK